jgi:hypothetical protein
VQLDPSAGSHPADDAVMMKAWPLQSLEQFDAEIVSQCLVAVGAAREIYF